jgi:hypothetical protein
MNWILFDQEHDNDGLSTLISVVNKAYSINPRIKFEVFIHKVDGLSDDHKIGMSKIKSFNSRVKCGIKSKCRSTNWNYYTNCRNTTRHSTEDNRWIEWSTTSVCASHISFDFHLWSFHLRGLLQSHSKVNSTAPNPWKSSRHSHLSMYKMSFKVSFSQSHSQISQIKFEVEHFVSVLRFFIHKLVLMFLL